MVAATGSGCGKTTFTTGLLYILKEKGVHAFKCGPDYIDPMFHKEVLNIPSANLDSYFCDDEMLKDVYERNMGEINIIEAAMGPYDGIGVSKKASAYEIAAKLNCGIILLVDGHGMGYSIVPLIKGFLLMDSQNLIKGIVINRISDKFFLKLKNVIEEETGVKVYGHIPKIKGAELSSRHLGLMSPDETMFDDKIKLIAEQITKSVDVDSIVNDFSCSLSKGDNGISKLAGNGVSRPVGNGASRPAGNGVSQQEGNGASQEESDSVSKAKTTKIYEGSLLKDGLKKYEIAVAKDEAFSFIYEENIKFLERCGARITYFSPLHDEKVPNNSDAIILYGGYPENYAGKLSENKQMTKSIKEAHDNGVKIIAECGGYMYMLESIMEDGHQIEMLGILKGYTYREKGLVRFGYVTVNGSGLQMRGHEFHHYEAVSVEYDDSLIIRGESSKAEYRGMVKTDRILAGFPHLYYLSCPEMITNFLNS